MDVGLIKEVKRTRIRLFQIPCDATAGVQLRNSVTTEAFHVLFGQSVRIPWGKGRNS
jgi:hypothetical protein